MVNIIIELFEAPFTALTWLSGNITNFWGNFMSSEFWTYTFLGFTPIEIVFNPATWIVFLGLGLVKEFVPVA